MWGIVKRIRGALAIGLTWGAAWGVIFAAIGLIAWAVDPGSIGPGEGAGVILGAAATSVFPLLTSADNGMLLFLCPMGAALAAGSVPAAKRAILRGPPEKPAMEDRSPEALRG